MQERAIKIKKRTHKRIGEDSDLKECEILKVKNGNSIVKALLARHISQTFDHSFKQVSLLNP